MPEVPELQIPYLPVLVVAVRVQSVQLLQLPIMGLMEVRGLITVLNSERLMEYQAGLPEVAEAAAGMEIRV
jgi:hypothetical protein